MATSLATSTTLDDGAAVAEHGKLEQDMRSSHSLDALWVAVRSPVELTDVVNNRAAEGGHRERSTSSMRGCGTAQTPLQMSQRETMHEDEGDQRESRGL